MTDCADCQAKDKELDGMAEDYGHLEDELQDLKDKIVDMEIQLTDAGRENVRLRLALGDIYARAGEMV